MAKLITIYWRDIPAQVTAFQEAIDMAAMRAGKGGSEEYLEGVRRVESECSNDLDTEVKKAAQLLEDQFDTAALQAIVKSKGIANPADDG